MMIKVLEFEHLVANMCEDWRDVDVVIRCIDDILNSGVLKSRTVDENILILLKKVIRELKSVPSLSIFMSSCDKYKAPQSGKYDTVDNIEDATRLFIKDRKNKEVKFELSSLSDQIGKEGLTGDISDKINALMKTDAVTVAYENVANRISDIYTRRVDGSGIKTKINLVDRVIGGLKEGQLSVIGGFTGQGKSTWAVSLTHSALEQGYNVCYISLELSAEHLMYSLISRHSIEGAFKATQARDLKEKTVDEDGWKHVSEDILPDLLNMPGKVYIMDEQDVEAYTFYSFDNKLTEIDNLAKQETGKGIDYIIVDHIQMLKFSDGSNKSENTVINAWVNYFRSQCLDFLKQKRKIHISLVAQINRRGWLKAAKKDGDQYGMYDLTSLKEANELESAASVVLTVFTTPDLLASNVLKVSILKNRDGERKDDTLEAFADFKYSLVGDKGDTSEKVMESFDGSDIFGASQMDTPIGGDMQGDFDEEFDIDAMGELD